jgi:hypothetical protein
VVEVCRTAVVKLNVDDSDVAHLQETVKEYLWAANYVVHGVPASSNPSSPGPSHPRETGR